ncbi:type 1 glutamine amidotransferase [Brevibacterium sp. UCMA 11754]|uniref:type 1 glutamine amidotransferase n=1 Tax=Brevibacterium sp. UCMA 11754 TaxID=2749198 RepID=UPI001F3339BC|nr:type 1 glutamine amidotransferase [Brevibacterium sp. UCMA 11754]
MSFVPTSAMRFLPLSTAPLSLSALLSVLAPLILTAMPLFSSSAGLPGRSRTPSIHGCPRSGTCCSDRRRGSSRASTSASAGELLAAATSAKIIRREHPQIGIYDLHTTSAGEEDPVFCAIAGETFPAVLFHQEEMELPDGGELLVTGSDAPIQGYRVGEFAWGTQFHPESDAAQVQQWLSSDPLRLPEGKTNESITTEAAEADADLIRINQALAHSFVHFLRGRP